jgi:hypothetical protein
MEGLWRSTQPFIAGIDKGDMFYPGERELYYKAWSEFLDVPTDSFRLHDPKLDGRNYASYGKVLLGEIVREVALNEHGELATKTMAWGKPSSWTPLVSECNLREEFNTRFGYLIGVPYVPNSLRAPARRVRFERAKRVPDFMRGVQKIDELYLKYAEVYSDEREKGSRVVLPVLFAAMVERIGRLEEFWECLADIRRKAKSFRQHRAELDQACAEGNLTRITEMEKAIRGDSQEAAKWVSSAVLSATSIPTTFLAAYKPALGAAALSVQLAFAAARPWIEKHSPGWLASTFNRIFSPRAWFLMDVSASARQITNARPKIERLWGKRLQKEFGIDKFNIGSAGLL